MQHTLSYVSYATASRLPALPKSHVLLPLCRQVGMHSYCQPRVLSRALHWSPSRFNSTTTATTTTTTPPSSSSAASNSSSTTTPSLPPPSDELSPPPETFKIEPRLAITFTCTVENCGHRSTHEFTKRSYEKGIVIVQCPGCKNRHLIADHMGWFKEITAEGQQRTIEDIMRAKGETVRRGRVDSTGGVTEFAPE